MTSHSNYEPKSGFERWLDTRLPIIRFTVDSLNDFPTPKNLNYWWTFGAIAAFCLAVQIVTGIVLAMHYDPSAAGAFNSVEQHIMRDVNYGWLIRGIHATGASMFFLAVYIHIARGIYYGSFKPPREVLWIIGCIIYFLMMATAFMGYVLPWGQMSFWGAKVITNLLGALPVVGKTITTLLWGGYSVDSPTLNRFYSLHYLLPFVIAFFVALHIWALHVPGNNNPVGINIRGKEDTVPFHPYYTVKDGFAVSLYVIMFAVFVFYIPDAFSKVDNAVPANPLVTPAHIVPEWYLCPFYAILRAIPDKLTGVLALFAAIGLLFVLPWLDTSKVRSKRYRPASRVWFVLWLLAFIALGWCGTQEPDAPIIPGLNGPMFIDYNITSTTWLARLATLYYFAWFIAQPFLGWFEKTLPVPDSLIRPVLEPPAQAGGAAEPARA
ncbi:MAG TPA: cytochrome b N-terminal domain-containing protein [Caulobacteraceae bacterium]|nr:cytochrome b N-terminal domain-containing protein [Caulobacteraceae bacterium]